MDQVFLIGDEVIVHDSREEVEEECDTGIEMLGYKEEGTKCKCIIRDRRRVWSRRL